MYFDLELPKNEDGTSKYPFLEAYTSPVKKPERTIVGRDTEMRRVMAAMERPELCNVILLAEAGSGKTALVQGIMLRDEKRYYIEVDLSRMISDLADKNQMADRLKSLFEETQMYCRNEAYEIVLFIDEFHQIVELSPAAVEALKPLLADSGTRGIRVIGATTFIEFRQWIAPNQPLVERLQRINLETPSKEMVVAILRSMARKYGVEQQFFGDMLFEEIYDLTNRYIPANAQPRKSILVFDAMVGWYKLERRRMDKKLLADVIYESEGVNIAFRVDASKIKEEIDEHVFAQEWASKIIQDRLQICVADLNDKTKPMSSFLFTGSTGVGKSVTCSTKIPIYTVDGSVHYKEAGDVVEGDYLFSRTGKPEKVLGVFPQGKRNVYRVTLGDGRFLDVSDNHLWAVYSNNQTKEQGAAVYTTETLLNKGVLNYNEKNGRSKMKYQIDMNQAVEWPEQKYKIHPYVIGSMIADGVMTSEIMSLSGNDEFIAKKVSKLLGIKYFEKESSKHPYGWKFWNSKTEYIKTKDLFEDFSEIYQKRAKERRIPEQYKYGSIEERWNLIQGLFDSNGVICSSDGGRFNISYSSLSKDLIYDIQDVLFSLGVASSVNGHFKSSKEKEKIEYCLHIKSSNEIKEKFFSLPRKLDLAKEAKLVKKQRIKSFDYVGIRNIEKLDYQEEMVCFYVDDDEHLFQAGQYIVTHNTEMTKQLARILFGDSRRLIRFDMTEYANEDSLDLFRKELTSRVWERPYSIILLDEVEKACAPVTRVLLQVLDDGRLTDENNREVPFVNSYIIMTTNAGNEVYKDIAQYSPSDSGSGEIIKKYQKLIQKSLIETTGDNRFPPELLGRIDCIVPFQPLSEKTQERIVIQKLMDLMVMLKEKHDITLEVKRDRVVNYIVKDNLDTDAEAGGARDVISKLESDVVATVAKAVNDYPDVSRLLVDYEGKAAFEDKRQLESQAHIVVKPVAYKSAQTTRRHR